MRRLPWMICLKGQIRVKLIAVAIDIVRKVLSSEEELRRVMDEEM